jgi:ribosome recycling factor
LLENIAVSAYGAEMTIKELGSITILDSQNLVVTPWDKTLLKEIGKAIFESELKINPVVDSTSIRVPIPALTEDRRKDLVKIVSSKVEEAKGSMRNIRQEFMKEIEKAFTEKTIGEDEKFTQKDEVEKIVKDFVSKCDEVGESKKTELLTI